MLSYETNFIVQFTYVRSLCGYDISNKNIVCIILLKKYCIHKKEDAIKCMIRAAFQTGVGWNAYWWSNIEFGLWPSNVKRLITLEQGKEWLLESDTIYIQSPCQYNVLIYCMLA